MNDAELKERKGETTIPSEARLNNCISGVSAQAPPADSIPVEPVPAEARENPPLQLYPLDGTIVGDSSLQKGMQALAGTTGQRGKFAVLEQRYAKEEGSVIGQDEDAIALAAGTGGFVAIRDVSADEARRWSQKMQQSDDTRGRTHWLFGGSLFVSAEGNTFDGWIEACFAD